MASKQPVWGIDVGQCSLKAVHLQAAGEGVELLGFDYVEHDQILSQAESDAAEMIRKAIETFAGRNDLSKSRVVVSVPGQQTLSRFTRMPPVDAKKIPDMVQYEASQQIPFDMDEVVWNYQVFTEGEAAEREVGIFAIRKELIHNYLSMFTSQKVEPVIVQTSPMASYNAARYELAVPENETFVLLDIGALATDFIIIDTKHIWARSLANLGGNRFTESLVTAFKVPFKKAEKLKRTAASSKYARQIFQAMRPVFAELVTELQRSIGFYTSTHRDAHITRIIGLGNAFKLPGLQKFVQQSVQMKVEKFSGFSKLVEVSNSKKAEFDENQMSLGVAYGLAVQGLGLASVNSNLLPPELRRTLLWQKKKRWFVASAACLALSAGAMFVGNVMAEGKVNEILGGTPVDQVALARISSVDAAESAINNTGGTALQRAMQVGGAAKFLKAEFNKYTSGSKDAATLTTLAQFPENNRYIPQVLDVIHRAFEEATPPELKGVKSNAEYKQLTRNTPRTARKEVYIQQIRMEYAEDPGTMFSAANDAVVKHGRPGWAIEITGITTVQDPASWLDATLARPMLEIGGEPKKGYYFDTISISRMKRRPATSGRGTTDAGFGPGGGDTGGRAGGGGRDGGTRGGGRGGRNQPTDDGGRRTPGFAGPGQPGLGGPADSGQSNDVRSLGTSFMGKDPLTMEDVTTDWEFVLEIVVRKDDTPNDRIPERYQEKKEEPGKADGATNG